MKNSTRASKHPSYLEIVHACDGVAEAAYSADKCDAASFLCLFFQCVSGQVFLL